MAKGSFDTEIKQAMAQDADSPKQPAKSAQVATAQQKPPAPKKPPQHGTMQLGMPHPGTHIPQPGASDPIAHATSIAHAILAHGRGY